MIVDHQKFVWNCKKSVEFKSWTFLGWWRIWRMVSSFVKLNFSGAQRWEKPKPRTGILKREARKYLANWLDEPWNIWLDRRVIFASWIPLLWNGNMEIKLDISMGRREKGLISDMQGSCTRSVVIPLKELKSQSTNTRGHGAPSIPKSVQGRSGSPSANHKPSLWFLSCSPFCFIFLGLGYTTTKKIGVQCALCFFCNSSGIWCDAHRSLFTRGPKLTVLSYLFYFSF